MRFLQSTENFRPVTTSEKTIKELLLLASFNIAYRTKVRRVRLESLRGILHLNINDFSRVCYIYQRADVQGTFQFFFKFQITTAITNHYKACTFNHSDNSSSAHSASSVFNSPPSPTVQLVTSILGLWPIARLSLIPVNAQSCGLLSQRSFTMISVTKSISLFYKAFVSPTWMTRHTRYTFTRLKLSQTHALVWTTGGSVCPRRVQSYLWREVNYLAKFTILAEEKLSIICDLCWQPFTSSTLYIRTSVCKFSILFSIRFLRC